MPRAEGRRVALDARGSSVAGRLGGLRMRHNPVVGALYFARGLRLITRPGVRAYVAIPLLINVVLFALAIWLGWEQVGDLVQRWLPDWEWLRVLVYPLFFIAVAIVLFFTFTLVGNLVAAPFNGLLAEAVERHLTGRGPNPEGGWKRLAREALHSILSEVRKLGYIVIRALPLLVLFVIPGLQAIAPFVWMAFSAWMLAISYMDYPMANHGLTFPEQRRRLRQRRYLGLGFGAAVMVALTIPFVNFLVIPCAVAGATALWVERLADLPGEPPPAA
jgi:CysZ protein